MYDIVKKFFLNQKAFFSVVFRDRYLKITNINLLTTVLCDNWKNLRKIRFQVLESLLILVDSSGHRLLRAILKGDTTAFLANRKSPCSFIWKFKCRITHYLVHFLECYSGHQKIVAQHCFFQNLSPSFLNIL